MRIFECRKCEWTTTVKVTWSRFHDCLRLSCRMCGYKWREVGSDEMKMMLARAEMELAAKKILERKHDA